MVALILIWDIKLVYSLSECVELLISQGVMMLSKQLS